MIDLRDRRLHYLGAAILSPMCVVLLAMLCGWGKSPSPNRSASNLKSARNDAIRFVGRVDETDRGAPRLFTPPEATSRQASYLFEAPPLPSDYGPLLENKPAEVESTKNNAIQPADDSPSLDDSPTEFAPLGPFDQPETKPAPRISPPASPTIVRSEPAANEYDRSRFDESQPIHLPDADALRSLESDPSDKPLGSPTNGAVIENPYANDSAPVAPIAPADPFSQIEDFPIEPQTPVSNGAPAARSPEMDAVARRAESFVRRGFDLAQRGALYSARRNFITAMQTVAQAADLKEAGRRRGAALAAGLTALEEADDFLSIDPIHTHAVDVRSIIASHRTPVLKTSVLKTIATGADAAEPIAPVVALERYYDFAREQLALAGARQPVASLALYGLGKTYLSLQSSGDPGVAAGGPKAIVAQQAALLVDDANYMAANELGVLLARCGQWQSARAALTHAANAASNPTLLENLAKIHQQLGERELAASVLAKARELEKSTASPESPSVVWVDPPTFAGTSANASPTGAAAGPAADDVKQQPRAARRAGRAAK